MWGRRVGQTDRALIAPPGPPPQEYCRLQLGARTGASTVQFSALVYQTLCRCHRK